MTPFDAAWVAMTLTASLVAGLVLGFAVVVMPGLATLPDRSIRSQSIFEELGNLQFAARSAHARGETDVCMATTLAVVALLQMQGPIGPANELLDMCLDTDLDSADYLYFRVMLDFSLSHDCQKAPPSCRLVRMGKPEGKDPTLWEESISSHCVFDISHTQPSRPIT